MEKLEDRALLAMLSLGPAGLQGAEGGVATLQVTISQPSMQATPFTFRTVSGTAMGGTDYQDFPNGNGAIQPYATIANISIQLFDDYFTDFGETFSVELLTATGATINPAASAVTVTIEDVESGGGSGGGGSTSLTISVPEDVNEGDAFTLTAQLSTPGVYQINAMVDWGATPGAGPTGFSGTTNPDGSFTIGHQYFDDGPTPGNGTPRDLQSITLTGVATQYTMQGPVYIPLSGLTSTTIHNVDPNPVFDVYNSSPVGGPSWAASATFQDVGLADRATLEINWGDGSPDMVLNDMEVGDSFWQEHHYPPDGLVYTITMTLTDDDTGVIAFFKDFELYLLDLDNDANSDGEISAIDEPFEPVTPGEFPSEPPTPGPGHYISVNLNDDNANEIPDMNEAGPISGENDLEQFLVTWEAAIRPDIDNYRYYVVSLDMTPYEEDRMLDIEPQIWLTPDKTGEVVSSFEDFYRKTWIVGVDAIPETLYLEARHTGGIVLQLRLWTPNLGTLIETDTIAFIAVDRTVDIAVPKFSVLSTQKFDFVGDGKTGAEIVAAVDEGVKAAITAKIRSVLMLPAGDPDPDIQFRYHLGGDAPLPYDPAVVAGQAGFAIGWVLGAEAVKNGAGVLTKVDFSKTVIVGQAYYIVDNEQVGTHRILFLNAGREYLDPGPADTSEHEFWHTDGISAAFKARVTANGIQLDPRMPPPAPPAILRNGFRLGIYSEARDPLMKHLALEKSKHNENLQALDTNPKAKTYISGKVDTFVTSAAVFAKIAEHGQWHSPDPVPYDLNTAYLYGGKWKWGP